MRKLKSCLCRIEGAQCHCENPADAIPGRVGTRPGSSHTIHQAWCPRTQICLRRPAGSGRRHHGCASQYMQWQIDGGSSLPGRGGLRLPTAVKVNEFGNIPGAPLQQLLVAKKEMRANGKQAADPGQSRRIRVSSRGNFLRRPDRPGVANHPRGNLQARAVIGEQAPADSAHRLPG